MYETFFLDAPWLTPTSDNVFKTGWVQEVRGFYNINIGGKEIRSLRLEESHKGLCKDQCRGAGDCKYLPIESQAITILLNNTLLISTTHHNTSRQLTYT